MGAFYLDFKSGFVSLIGRPNAGKSTLLNALVGRKVAIVADKPQTTRTSIQGVLHAPGAQVIFVDTPGIHRADTPLNKRLMIPCAGPRRARPAALPGGRLAPVRGGRPPRRPNAGQERDAGISLVLNKIDLVKEKARLLPLIEQYKRAFAFADYLPVSATRGEGLKELTAAWSCSMPEGPHYFPEDYLTDQPERFLAAELIREKALAATRQEVPHAVTVIWIAGTDPAAHSYLRHAAGGARRAEAHLIGTRGYAEAHRHAGAAGDRAPAGNPGVSRPAYPRAAGVARKAAFLMHWTGVQ